MSAFLSLPMLSIVATFYLRILASYLLCLALSHAFSRHHARFLVWKSFLLGAAFYWAFLVAGLAGVFSGPEIANRNVANGAVPYLARVAAWNIPSGWSNGVENTSAILIWGYAFGVVISLLIMLQRHVQLRRFLRNAIPVSPEVDHIFAELCRRLEVRRCRIFKLAGLTSPATAYHWRPLILLPESIESYLDKAQLGDVLSHELMHVRRRDFLWSIVTELVRCLLLFHPAIWLGLRNLRRERELACDAAVVRHRQDRRPDYAECLTRIARACLTKQRSRVVIESATPGSFLALRVQTLLAEPRRPSLWKRGATFTSSLTMLAAYLILWPAVAIVLQYRPMVTVAALPSITRAPAGFVHRSQLHHSKRSSTTPSTPLLIPALSIVQTENVPPPPILSLASASKPSFPVGVDNSFRLANSSRTNDSETNTDRDEAPPPIDEIPVPRKSGTQKRSIALPTWRKVVISAAVAAVAGVVMNGGSQNSDQTGEQNLEVPRK